MCSARNAIISGFVSQTMTMRPGSRKPRKAAEFSSTELTAVKIAVFAPMPRASAITAVAVIPGL